MDIYLKDKNVTLHTAKKYCEEDINVNVECDKLSAIPSAEEQNYSGIFDEVNIKPIPEEYIVPEGTIDIKENETVDVKEYEFANVNVVPKPMELKDNQYVIKAVDYDGTVLKEEYLESGKVFELPELPTHEGLIAQGWSCSSEIVDNKIIIDDNDVIAGVMYKTESGASEFDIEFNRNSDLTINLHFNLQIVGYIDWGDGTIDTSKTHTYASYGEYTIKFYGMTHISGPIFSQLQSDPNYFLKKVRLAETITSIASSGLGYCYSLISVSMPENILSIGEGFVRECRLLPCIVIPKNITGILQRTCYNNYSLKYMIIPQGVEGIGSYVCTSGYSLKNIIFPKKIANIDSSSFTYCYSLERIIIPQNVISLGTTTLQYSLIPELILGNSVETIGERMCFNCFMLKKVIFSANLKSIAAYAFYECKVPAIYDFSKIKVVPTLANVNAFTGINKATKIIVPDELYDEWIAATNWSIYADHIVKKSEVT